MHTNCGRKNTEVCLQDYKMVSVKLALKFKLVNFCKIVFKVLIYIYGPNHNNFLQVRPAFVTNRKIELYWQHLNIEHFKTKCNLNDF